MTKRYPLGGALGGSNSSDSSHLQGVAFGVLQAANGPEHAWTHVDEGFRDRDARGERLGRYIDHSDFPPGRIVRELTHASSLRYVLAEQYAHGFSGLEFVAIAWNDQEAVCLGQGHDIA